MEETQTCYLCKEAKPLSHFIRRIDDTHYNMCRSCLSSLLLTKKTRDKLHHTLTHRTCYLCRRFLPVSEFTRRSNGSYFSGCKECNANVFAQRRRARLANSTGSFTTKEWVELVSKYDHCPKCLRRWQDIPNPRKLKSVITRDHIVPLARGGSNAVDNIQPLCYSCNSKKGHR